MPSGRCWPSFGLTIANVARHDQIRIVHDSTKTDRKGITKFTTFMYRPRGFSIDVTGKSPSCTEAADQIVEAFGVSRVMRVEFSKGAFQPEIGQDRWCSMARTNNVKHIQVVLLDKEVEM
jgi:purine-nucleoside phosphorylase